MAGTYVNGQVEDSLGGGICQVSTTLYNAVLLAELDVVERYPHSMSVGYVPLSMDAALAGTWKDLKIRNNTDTPIYIEGIYSSGKITFNIYGVETRPSNRTIEYKSETLSTVASTEVVTKNPDLPEGYRAVTSSGHTGYKARLLKRVYIDGVLQSEEVVNNSTYSSSPTYVTVGTGAAQTEEPSTEAQQQETTAQETIAQPSAKPQESGQQEQPAASSNGQSASSSSDSSSSTSSSSASSSEASGQGTQTNNGDSSSSGTGTENTGTN
jgi:cell division septation protein DedD